jgi:hypothetical protein
METEQTRARLTETLDELRAMSPGRVLDEVLDFAKESGGEMLRGLGRQISENPIPPALIAAGIVWMTMANKSGADKTGNGTGDGESRVMGDGITNAANSAMRAGSDLSAKAGSAMQGAKETFQSAASGLGSAASAIGDTASSAYGTVAGTASRTASTVKNAAGSIADSTMALEQSALQATRGLLDFCKDQPLVLAGLGLALGAALGAAIPETEAEERLLGETADEVKQKVQRLAAEKAQKVKEAGEHIVEETVKIAKQELASVVGDTPGQNRDENQQQNQGQQNQGSGSDAGQSADQSRGTPLSGQPGLQRDEQQSQSNPSGDYNPSSGQRPIH